MKCLICKKRFKDGTQELLVMIGNVYRNLGNIPTHPECFRSMPTLKSDDPYMTQSDLIIQRYANT